MRYDAMGFIGGGRITKIFLTALQKKGKLPKKVMVSDTDPDVLGGLQNDFPFIIAENDNAKPASCDLVFVSLHPPVMVDALNQIKTSVRPEAVVVSLAPKITLSRLTAILDRHARIVRMIPNAPSIMGSGYNPVTFSRAFSAAEKPSLLTLFGALGRCPEVPEETLEAYAITAAMGPTYFWFQWQKLIELARSFGLSEAEAKEAVASMLKGSVETMFGSSLIPSEVMDLVAVRPLAEDESAISDMYQTRLTALYSRLKG